MPMTQEDIRRHYEGHWKQRARSASAPEQSLACDGIEDAVVTPIYQQLISDLSIRVNGGRVLDVGCGSGRWIRFFLDRFRPALLVGVDATQASIDLLEQGCDRPKGVSVAFKRADITEGNLNLGELFNLINIANVLFHIPEEHLFRSALRNLAKHLAPGGRVITTEYLPRATMRTEWMLVRSRYDFEKAVISAGLRIVEIRAFGFLAQNDPMGVDGPTEGTRLLFNKVRQGVKTLFDSDLDEKGRAFFVELFANIERACLAYCRERIADIDLPSQKLVVLAPATAI